MIGRIFTKVGTRRGPVVGFLFVTLSALLTGCTVEEQVTSTPAGPGLVPVRGTVRVDGKPLAGAVVAFMPVFDGTGTHAVGGTAADGSFSLSYLDTPGAAPGEYRVVVSYLVGAGGAVVDLAARSGEVIPESFNTAKELLPPRYSHPSRTELRAAVGPAGLTIDLDLRGPLGPAA